MSRKRFFAHVSSLGSELVKSVDLSPPKEKMDCEIGLYVNQTSLDQLQDIVHSFQLPISATIRYLLSLGLEVYRADPEEQDAESTEFERILKERA